MARGTVQNVAEFKEVKVGGESLFVARRGYGFTYRDHLSSLRNAAVEGQRVLLTGIEVPQMALIVADSTFVQDLTNGGTEHAATWTARINLSRYGVKAEGFHNLDGERFVSGRGETVEDTLYVIRDKINRKLPLWFDVGSDDGTSLYEWRFLVDTGGWLGDAARVVVGRLASEQAVQGNGRVAAAPEINPVLLAEGVTTKQVMKAIAEAKASQETAQHKLLALESLFRNPT